MPLRDHFRSPLDDSRSCDELHGAWPTVMVMALNQSLPSRYVAAPRVHLGPNAEIDVTAYEMVQQRVSVALVDLVTTRRFNLYVEILDMMGQTDPSLSPEPPVVYAAACRWARKGDTWRFRAWTHRLAIEEPLPLLPLWLADNLAVPWSSSQPTKKPAASCA